MFLAAENENLHAIRRESGNDMLLYGRDMPRVKQMIEQYKSKFEHEPRGPLGEINLYSDFANVSGSEIISNISEYFLI